MLLLRSVSHLDSVEERMNLKILAATAAGCIVMFALVFGFYSLLADPFLKTHAFALSGDSRQVAPQLLPLILGNLVWSWMLAFVLDTWAQRRTFVGGMSAGAAIIFPFALGTDLQLMSLLNLDPGIAAIASDVIGITFIGAVTGGVIGLVLGFMSKRDGEIGELD